MKHFSLFLLVFCTSVLAFAQNDSIYQGTTVKAEYEATALGEPTWTKPAPIPDTIWLEPQAKPLPEPKVIAENLEWVEIPNFFTDSVEIEVEIDTLSYTVTVENTSFPTVDFDGIWQIGKLNYKDLIYGGDEEANSTIEFMDDGTIWFIQGGEIKIYDGKNIKTIKLDYTSGIGEMYRYNDRTIYFNSGNYFIKYDGNYFVKYSSKEFHIETLGFFKFDGMYFFGFNNKYGLNYLKKSNNKFYKFNNKSSLDFLYSQTNELKKNDFLFFETKHSIGKIDLINQKIFQLTILDSTKRKWGSSYNLLSFNIDSTSLLIENNILNKIQILDLQKNVIIDPSYPEIDHFHMDIQNNIWLVDRNNDTSIVYKIDMINSTITEYNENHRIRIKGWKSIQFDQRNDFWIDDTENKALLKYDFNKQKDLYELLGLYENSGVAGRGKNKYFIRNINYTTNGLWLSSSSKRPGIGNGAYLMKDNYFLHYKYFGDMKPWVSGIGQTSISETWFHLSWKGLLKLENDEIQFYSGSDLGYNEDNEFGLTFDLERMENEVWFGIEKGVSKIMNDSLFKYTYPYEDNTRSGEVYKIHVDNKNYVWFLTFDKTIYAYTPSNDFLIFNDFKARGDDLFEEINDTLFYRKRNAEYWFNYKTSQLVFKRKVESYNDPIFSDKNENSWYSNGNDFSVESINGRIAKYDLKEGIKYNYLYQNAVFKDYFINNKKILDYNKWDIDTIPPIFNLTDVIFFNQFVDFHQPKKIEGVKFGVEECNYSDIQFSSVTPFYNLLNDLVLPHYFCDISFRFSGIHWENPHRATYSYLLEGQDEKWGLPNSENKVDFKNLEAGEYTFKVKAISSAGVESQIEEFSFTILPAWWQTWWARLLYVLVFGLLVFAIIRWRTASLRKRQQELELEVNNATEEIRSQRDAIEETNEELNQTNEELAAQRDEIEKQKEVVEEAHKEITDSINYAKRIQNAILPATSLIKENLPESFVYYQPKDVVAGDFYWLEQVGKTTLFAAADCTGHGVPGAMVSVVCHNAMNRSVREFSLTEPGLILDKTRELVLEEFSKSSDDVKDGMDIALCSLSGNKLQYAGAHNPLWVIRNNEILETKADKQPIGKFEKTSPFITHTIELQKGDSIYVFSDGYPDQFGGPNDKKFGSKRLKELLISIQDKSMTEQNEVLESTLQNWITEGNDGQIDDICVFGLTV